MENPNDSRKEMEIGVQKHRSATWLGAVVPFNIALGPIATLIQLLILQLNGTVIDVALAITLFNAVSIPAAVIWGLVTDRFHRRKAIIVACYLASAAILVSFLLADTEYWVAFLYAAFSFVTAASTTPLNLLVMETAHKVKWATAFARFSMITSIGQTAGLILGVIWGLLFPLTFLVVVLAILSVVSATLADLMIVEPKVVFERQAITLNKSSFFHRILSVPIIFLKIPHLHDFRKVFRDIKYDLTRQVPILYFSIFAFYLASGIFNTSIVPSLHANNISSFLIFLVTTVAMVVQIVSFRFAGPYIERKFPAKAAKGGLILRSLGYGFLGLSLYISPGILFLMPVLVFYPLAAGIAYSVYYTASNTMIFNTLHPGRKGSSLGVYSALVGIAIMLGSFVSGFTSFYLGYSITFIIAAVLLAVSAWLCSLLGPEK